MLQVSLGCPFLITPSVFSNVYLRRYVAYHHYPFTILTSDLMVNFVFIIFGMSVDHSHFDVLCTTMTHICPSNLKTMSNYSIFLGTFPDDNFIFLYLTTFMFYS